jgi:hypothetical protein
VLEQVGCVVETDNVNGGVVHTPVDTNTVPWYVPSKDQLPVGGVVGCNKAGTPGLVHPLTSHLVFPVL